jgi:uncharacterized protein HemY
VKEALLHGTFIRFAKAEAKQRGENIEEALNLAQSAKEQFPDDANISDTLGWVYYKKNIFSRAVYPWRVLQPAGHLSNLG